MWGIVFTKRAIKDSKIILEAGLREKTKSLLAILEKDPFQNSPPYDKLIGDLTGAYSRRINIQYRLVYEVFQTEKIVRVLRMWTHFE